jgi:hypothetical protein
MQISLLPPYGYSIEDKDIEDVLIFEREDIQLLYNALSRYKSTTDEDQRYGLLLEELEEILTIDNGDEN